MWFLVIFSVFLPALAADHPSGQFRSLALRLDVDRSTPSSDMGTPRSITTDGSATPSAIEREIVAAQKLQMECDLKKAREVALIAGMHSTQDYFKQLQRQSINDLFGENSFRVLTAYWNAQFALRPRKSKKKTFMGPPYPAPQTWVVTKTKELSLEGLIWILREYDCYLERFIPRDGEQTWESASVHIVKTRVDMPKPLKKIRKGLAGWRGIESVAIYDAAAFDSPVRRKVRFSLDN